VRRLLDEIRHGMSSDLVSVNIAYIERETGVNRQTIHNWINADSDNPDDWLSRYDGETARQLTNFFSRVLGRDVEIIERIEISEDPKLQKTVTVAAAAA
jgi:hypothetical protein